MSKSTKWIIGILVIVIIILALWWGGVFGGSSSPSQSASAVNGALSTSTLNTASNSLIASELAAIDTQLAKAGKDLSAMSKAPTQMAIASDTAEFQAASNSMGSVIVQLQTRLTNAKTAGANVTAAMAMLSDANVQLQNGGSQAQVAVKNTSTQPTAAQLKTAYSQLVSAQSYYAAARKDLGSVAQALIASGK